MKKTKILIPYASYGSGHKTVAKGIAEHLIKNNPNYEVLCIDILKYLNPLFEKFTTNFYEKICFKIPLFLEILYRSTDFNSASFHKLYNHKRLRKIILDFKPDIVVSTHFFPSRIIADYKLEGLLETKIITIVTDYKTHAQWLTNKKVEDAIIVNTKIEKRELIKKGFKKERVKTFGIPISERFYDVSLNKEELKKSFNINNNYPIILFLGGGSSGVKASLRYLKYLLELNKKVNILFISGTNPKIKKKATDLKKKYNNNYLKVYGFITNMPEFLTVADFVITKPGGATVTECLHLNKPMVLISLNAGQEKENYKYIVQSNFGKKTYTSFFFKRTVSHLIDNPKAVEKMTANISKAHNEKALFELDELIKEMI